MEKIKDIRIDEIYPHPDNPRKNIGDIDELADSIKKNGVMQNMTVISGHEVEPGMWSKEGYTLLIGHRRCAAAKEAGLKSVPCRVVDGLSRNEQVSIMLTENMQRSDLTVLEQAEGFQMMLDLGDTEQDIAEKTGFSRTTVRHRLELNKLDKSILKNKTEDLHQLTITDLLQLEKIESKKERNRILKESNSSEQIQFKVNSYLERKRKDEKAAVIKEHLHAHGVKEAPENFNRWNGKWQLEKTISLEEKASDKPTIPKGENLIVVQSYAGLDILKKIEKKKKQVPESEKIRQENSKKIKELRNELHREINIFLKTSNSRMDKSLDYLWKIQIELDSWIRKGYIANEMFDVDIYEWRRNLNEYQIDDLNTTPIPYQMAFILNYEFGQKDLADYYLVPKKEIIEKLKDFISILEMYGFDIENKEIKQILDYTSPYFKKEKEDDTNE